MSVRHQVLYSIDGKNISAWGNYVGIDLAYITLQLGSRRLNINIAEINDVIELLEKASDEE